MPNLLLFYNPAVTSGAGWRYVTLQHIPAAFRLHTLLNPSRFFSSHPFIPLRLALPSLLMFLLHLQRLPVIFSLSRPLSLLLDRGFTPHRGHESFTLLLFRDFSRLSPPFSHPGFIASPSSTSPFPSLLRVVRMLHTMDCMNFHNNEREDRRDSRPSLAILSPSLCSCHVKPQSFYHQVVTAGKSNSSQCAHYMELHVYSPVVSLFFPLFKGFCKGHFCRDGLLSLAGFELVTCASWTLSNGQLQN